MKLVMLINVKIPKFIIYITTEPIDAVNILPLMRLEPTTLATPPSTTPDIDATNYAIETSPQKDVQEATNAVHVVYWFFFNGLHLFKWKPDGSKDKSEIR